MLRLPILPRAPVIPFPPVDQALTEPNGLLCAGGDLSEPRLLLAYRHGIFPWFSEGEPILWWSPDPRAVFELASCHPNSRSARYLRRSGWTARVNFDFEAVIDACAAPRDYASGTWITSAMRAAYLRLHQSGHAHCLGTYAGDELVGGIYGIAIGRVFFGESMFSRRPNASMHAFYALAGRLREAGFELLDGQVESAHLMRLGAHTISRSDFVARLESLCTSPPHDAQWHRQPD